MNLKTQLFRIMSTEEALAETPQTEQAVFSHGARVKESREGEAEVGTLALSDAVSTEREPAQAHDRLDDTLRHHRD